MNCYRVAGCLLSFLGWLSAAHGNVVISVQNQTGTPGTTALVGVFAYTTAADQLQGFNLPLDVNNNGNGLVSGLTFNATPIQNFNPGLVFEGFNTALNNAVNTDDGGIDGVVNGSSVNPTGLPLSTSSAVPTKLFDVALDISPTLVPPPGGLVVPISIITDTFPLFNVYSVTTNPSTTVTVTSGSLTVSVPESATMINLVACTLLVGLIGFGLFRRR
jgi:hypothetical protein